MCDAEMEWVGYTASRQGASCLAIAAGVGLHLEHRCPEVRGEVVGGLESRVRWCSQDLKGDALVAQRARNECALLLQVPGHHLLASCSGMSVTSTLAAEVP